jgi:hypothetical protein
MAQATVVTYDLDFYAFSAWQLREAGQQARKRLQTDGLLRQPLDQLLADLDAAIPYLKDYRDMMTHAVDDVLDDLMWFGDYAGRQLPDGSMEYVIDARHGHHDALEDFFAGLVGVLGPLGSEVTRDENNRSMQSRPR